MKKTKLVWKLFPSFLLITVALLLVQTVYMVTSTKSYLIGYKQSELIERSGPEVAKIEKSYVTLSSDLNVVIARTSEVLGARVTLVRTNGQIIADSHQTKNLPNISDYLQSMMLLQAEPHATVGKIFSSDQMIICSVPIQEKQELLAAVIVQVPAVGITDIFSKLSGEMTLSLLISILIAALATWFVAWQMTRTLAPINEGLEKFIKGDLNHRIKPPSTLELARVAEGMNHAARMLKQNVDNVESQRNLLDAVLESMNEGVMAISETERILGMNEAACQLIGVRIENVRGRLMQEVTRNTSLLAFIRAMFDEPQPKMTEIIMNADQERIIRLHGSPLNVPGTDKKGIIVVMTDITDIRRLERIRKDFVANVSHELRTPITSIKGFVETLLSESDTILPEQQRFLQIISKHTERLNQIIEDLLELAKIEEAQEKGTVEFEASNIETPIKSAIAFLAHKAQSKNITVESTVESCLCRINPQLIEHAVANYIDNAINFSQPDSKVTVTGTVKDKSYIVTVKDNGQGMEKRHLPRIFERFYRAQAGRDRQAGGTGLGLAIVKHIIEAHGGTVSADSELGIGSTFAFTIPLV